MQIDKDFLMPLNNVLRGLNGVSPQRVLPQIRILFETFRPTGFIVPNAFFATAQQFREALSWDKNTYQILVTPFGASVFVDLYKEEILPLRYPGKTEIQVSPEILLYIGSESELREKTREKALRIRRMQELLQDYSDIIENDLSHELLCGIFAKQAEKNASVLQIGGLRVTRYVSTIMKKGKMQTAPSVTFRWTSSDGSPRELSE
ncbi:hypothetical protein [Noviherbaspirillum pedocola]|uniref:Uncharacterized protein n=1 Tax=Noviherbaspirillum pedocola TaxID=2801341 RepID=A0A934T314_9BURK|nr:hypothetical protein [Noviherbaspirillum pedocola]MBK4737333.1 hypothetical protein [Noviherbaspirillum pedocola]